ncbi:unnamed protein product [Peniophora sp. CBMAI 1063]|nr:unnamed protein product [Peniophora sp. CBMAI 1063]
MAAPESLRILDLCAEYGRASFLKGISACLGNTAVPSPVCPDEVPIGFQAELRVVAQRCIEAVTNRRSVRWSARTYAASIGTQSGDEPDFEAVLQERYPPLDGIPPTNEPLSIVDEEDVILFCMTTTPLWADEPQAIVASTISLASAAIAAHPPKPDNEGKTSRWRHSRYLYAKEADLVFGRGQITLSPGWLAQAQQGYNDTLYVSRDLAARPDRVDNAAQISAQAWLGANFETGLLLSTALAIVHPAQYRETRQALGYLSTLPDFRRHTDDWTFAFNAVTLICNRLTPLHRDRASGGIEFYDLLLSIGGGPRAVLSLPGLGICVQYDSGAAALFSGNQHLHEVWGFQEERACVACYARPAVIRWLGAKHPPLPSGSNVLPDGRWQTFLNVA